MKMNVTTIAARTLFAAFALISLHGCFPIVATGMGAAVLMADDRRTSGAYIEDEAIENKAMLRANQRFSDGLHLNVTSYNRLVLLTGEAPSEQARTEIEKLVRGIDNVRGVQNEMIVAPTSTMMIRSNDTVQTSKIKARFVEANRFRPNHVKVVTENSIAYLLGIVKRKEADDATNIARTTSGVQRVVRVFEYLD